MEFGDSLWYADDFHDAFLSNDIPNIGPETSLCDDNQNGILVGMKDPSHPTEMASKFIAILTEMGMNPAPTVWSHPPNDSAFDLFICGEAKILPAVPPRSTEQPASPRKS
jgi:hypothetical protein